MRKLRNSKVNFAAPILKLVLFMFFAFYFSPEAECQAQSETRSRSVLKGGSYEETFSTSRIGVAQSVMTTPGKEFHVVIQHRFTEIEGGLYNFFGMDGALPRVGFEYGFTDWLSGEIGRSLFEKTYDLDLKVLLLKQNETNIPVSLSYFISLMDNTLKNYFPVNHDSFGSRLSFANQLFVSRNQGIFSVQLSPLWLHSDYEIRNGGPVNIYAIDMAGRIKIFEKIGFIAEYINILTNTTFTRTNPFTIGLDINTGGHQFQLIFTNSQGLNEKAYLTNTDGDWSKGRVYFGFNLTRVFNRQTY